MGDNLLVCTFPLITLEPNQLNLFSDLTVTPARRAETLLMSLEALLKWKSQIFEYQHKVRENKPPQQTALFDLTPKHCDPDQIDPLLLRLVPMSFYRIPANSPGDACLYFIIDSAASVVLYVGETCRSNKRWQGIHACKDYIASYQDLYYRYGLKTAVNAAFWWDAPVDRRTRQELELNLILKWRSPFNKENWERWGQPFG
ncbi:GIY-YIG nuclease family protein [Nostoc sp. UHCC 0252]|uniref:GIY-YIG nuclease family protein n=1 Tax=Nostoc sp. UHCC 0252 TaxID=3110241 RepID=UPI002B205ACB|nr:GIY-YIG nuclease family protein [Nostoc sp. UHCC 0252]MEA5604686.1 GIY-YIG nuclease family protein [Nostoc sp. UHCC 0252]